MIGTTEILQRIGTARRHMAATNYGEANDVLRRLMDELMEQKEKELAEHLRREAMWPVPEPYCSLCGGACRQTPPHKEGFGLS